MSDQAIEQEIQAKGLTAPRVTPADVEANIEREVYFTAANGASAVGEPVYSDDDSLRLLTFCVLVLKNGFTVTGESACASPENFDAELGRKIARQNAIAKVWPLMGYALKERLAVLGDAEPGSASCSACTGDEVKQKLRAALVGMVGTDDPANLRDMLDALRASGSASEDATVAAAAVEALLETVVSRLDGGAE